MEAEFAQGSELSQINPGGMPENTVDADTFPEESLEVKGLITKTQKIARNICLPLRNASVKTEKMSKGENTFEYDARISWIANCIELSNFSLKFVLGVSIVSLLIGLIIGFKD